jgi:hypothetical protein
MGTHKSVVHKHEQLYNPAADGSVAGFPDGMRQLAANSLLQATVDWVNLIYAEDKAKTAGEEVPTKRVYKYKTRKVRVDPDFDEIRQFLTSDWGKTICSVVDIKPGVILNRLEHWLITYRTKGVLPRKLTIGGWTPERKSK